MRSKRGFTLIECAISTILLSGLLIAGLRAVSMEAKMRVSAAEEARAAQLAESMLSEVMANYVGEPSTGLVGGLVSGLLGIDVGENAARKQTFDDIDDYSGWSESPPQYEDGTTIPGYTGWTRSVKVENVKLSDPTSVTASRTGLVRVTVTVTIKGGRAISLAALRADAIQSFYKVPSGHATTDMTFIDASVLP